jgi:hypothetical protein
LLLFLLHSTDTTSAGRYPALLRCDSLTLLL